MSVRGLGTAPRVLEVLLLEAGTVVEQFGQVVTLIASTFKVRVQGGFTLVDPDHLNLLLGRRWNVRPHRQTSYVRYNGRRERLNLHTSILAATGDLQCDHRNGAGWDNRLCNLRLATPTEQARNHRRSRNKFVPYKGITYDRKKRLYQARIMVNGKAITLGRRKCPKAAARLYDEAARHYFGAFATFNFPTADEAAAC